MQENDKIRKSNFWNDVRNSTKILNNSAKYFKELIRYTYPRNIQCNLCGKEISRIYNYEEYINSYHCKGRPKEYCGPLFLRLSKDLKFKSTPIFPGNLTRDSENHFENQMNFSCTDQHSIRQYDITIKSSPLIGTVSSQISRHFRHKKPMIN